jgi:hypothetical protein
MRHRTTISLCKFATPLIALLALTGCGKNQDVAYAGPAPKASPIVNWPKATASRGIENPIWVTGTMDGEMVRYFGLGELATASQDEGQEPLFILDNGATLENVILGEPAADGIHCQGSCTLRNVWWERVGEDAATFRGKTVNDVMLVEGGGASGARDKVFQSNAFGTMIIKDFYVEWFGKLYRSCGNCSKQTSRKVILQNVTAIAGPDTEALVGVNVNFGDTAEFRGKSTLYDPTGELAACQIYEGNNTGDEPSKIGPGKDGATCVNVDSNLTVLSEWNASPALPQPK